MSIIPQKQLFSWEKIENLGDLERLRLVVEYMPDEKLMRLLEKERGRGRDDYPVRPVWNSILAGIVYQHPSIESLRRELLRNGQLRMLCGFEILKGSDAVAPSYVYTRFLKKLMKHQDEIEDMFDKLVEDLRELLPGFGKNLAFDGKAIPTHARRAKKDDPPKEPDGRRDIDADTGKKTYRGKREDGTLWEKMKEWFGYKLHLVVDADYELPVAFAVTKASRGETPIAKALFADIEEKNPGLLDTCDYAMADRGYDDGKLIKKLYDGYGIKPVIDIRNMWKDGEATKLLSGTRNVVYNYKGEVSCVCMKTGEQRPMAFGGFEKDREMLKYRCPAAHYGIECSHWKDCPVRGGVRISLEEDRRIFTPLARSSYKWKRIYRKRTSVERVNSRLDVSFGFEHHFIRGLKKMKLRCSLALVVMLAMAKGHAKENRPEMVRSLVRVA